ncbi:MAG: bifunctional methylenetetrahydrofolate dehydrogenase/methenyltetrahydrofolate cyclohydrolase FolD [Alphaproteobacteria bacterium]|nr:bifunctional methylenetetrahydrofolate dehydrogenase/methenyltetrahydrofolate cyclohydrolase FolD [Alphaproteobacteria bacterium]
MTANILNGKELALSIRQNLKQQVDALTNKPCLAVVLAGDNEASKIYVKNKLKAAEEIGIETSLFLFDNDVTQAELENLVARLNEDKKINGIMLQLPLPDKIDEKAILNMISPEKDVDGFHPYNIGLLQNNSDNAVIAATPKGIIRLLENANVDFEGKNALVIGRSQIVGKPVAMLLLNKNCTVTVAHSKTKNLENLVAQADILVSACGCPKLIKGSWIKQDAIIVDVGINRIDGKLCGDVDFDSAKEKAKLITPVPGGVGPMTIAMLLENTFLAYKKQNKL